MEDSSLVPLRSFFNVHGRNPTAVWGVSSLYADPAEELLWVGSNEGVVTSYYSWAFEKHTSWQAHTSAVRQTLVYDDLLVSVGGNNVRLNTKQGVCKSNVTHDEFKDLYSCVLSQRRQHTLVVGGAQQALGSVNLLRGSIVSVAQPDNLKSAIILRPSSRFICAASEDGTVTLLDPSDLSIANQLQAHKGGISDMDVSGNLLVTCGSSPSPRPGQLSVDPFIKIFDLRAIRPLQPLHSMSGPIFARFVPSAVFASAQLAILSQHGQIQFQEPGGAVTAASMLWHQVETVGQYCTAFTASSSGEMLFVGDAGGGVHCIGTKEETVFNYNSFETVFAEHHTVDVSIAVDDMSQPLSQVPTEPPVQDTRELPLSHIPSQFCHVNRRPAPAIPPELLSSTRWSEFVGSAPNVLGWKRNQIPYAAAARKLRTPRSLRGAAVTPRHRRNGRSSTSPMKRQADVDGSMDMIEKPYRRVNIQYSRLGVEDFDFGHYNQTNLCGLEIHIPNAYCNSMLQVLYFLAPFRAACSNHYCDSEHCLACELGFLFHMLDQRPARNCQATNFLRSFRTIPQATALGLILNEGSAESAKADLSGLIQSWHRFVLSQVDFDMRKAATFMGAKGSSSGSHHHHHKGRRGKDKQAAAAATSVDDATSVVTDLWGSTVVSESVCQACKHKTSKPVQPNLFTLQTPEGLVDDDEALQAYTFSNLLVQSLQQERQTQAWCEGCSEYKLTTQRRQVKALPNILALNCGIETDGDRQFWTAKAAPYVKARLDKTGASSVAAKLAAASLETEQPSAKIACRFGDKCTRPDCKFAHDIKPKCRYGANCNNPTCHFDHSVNGSLAQGVAPTTASETTPTQEAPAEEQSLPKALPPSWIPSQLFVRVKGDRVSVTESHECPSESPMEGKDYRDKSGSLLACGYELVAAVHHVREPRSCGNLVAHVRVSAEDHLTKTGVPLPSWYLLNDFSVTPTKQSEAVFYNMQWKVPCVFYYVRRDFHKRFETKVNLPLSFYQHKLLHDKSIAMQPMRQSATVPLTSSELPKQGDVVAIDAEFVSLAKEEAEIRSGTRQKSTIKPSQLAVARITVVRAGGLRAGVPFIDDYIKCSEQVVDYLTQFSGINPGDLDPSVSDKHLTTLKNTYMKLRYLELQGVRFLGHGLSKDFRVINITPPPHQVIDTVTLFHLSGRRKISLRFLAWNLLKINMQCSYGHDSAEDAKTAMLLYDKYNAIREEHGARHFHDFLQQLYEAGHVAGWKVPDAAPGHNTL
eukprot:m.238457 g.238457  ORF g.238457 m.238457 type:complete len:1258 (+) comp18968_c0_seq2:2845-6618(+)